MIACRHWAAEDLEENKALEVDFTHLDALATLLCKERAKSRLRAKHSGGVSEHTCPGVRNHYTGMKQSAQRQMVGLLT